MKVYVLTLLISLTIIIHNKFIILLYPDILIVLIHILSLLDITLLNIILNNMVNTHNLFITIHNKTILTYTYTILTHLYTLTGIILSSLLITIINDVSLLILYILTYQE
jgi:hypothetical protein